MAQNQSHRICMCNCVVAINMPLRYSGSISQRIDAVTDIVISNRLSLKWPIQNLLANLPNKLTWPKSVVGISVTASTHCGMLPEYPSILP